MVSDLKAVMIIMVSIAFCAGCIRENVPLEQAAIDWEEQARAHEGASEWKRAAGAWQETAEAWEKQADVWEDAGEVNQANYAREKSATDWEAKGDSCRDAAFQIGKYLCRIYGVS